MTPLERARRRRPARRRWEARRSPSRRLCGAAPLLLWAGLCACSIDDPNLLPAPGSAVRVDRLSQLGIFEGDAALQQPRPDFFAYDVNVSLYSDGAQKFRFVYVPPGDTLRVTSDRWDVPTGSYLVKTFYYPLDARDPSLGRRLLETRFLVKQPNGYQYSLYVWNDRQTDATASGGNVDVPVSWIDRNGLEHDDTYHVPGLSMCHGCHGGRALGLRNRQMSRGTPNTADDQIAHLVASGVLDVAPAEPDPLVDPFGPAPLDDRARAYLDANCSHCHAPDGEAASTHLYWSREDTDGPSLPRCRATDSVDGRDRVLVPGQPQQSAFLARMRSSDPFIRMPRGPVHVPDGAGIAVLTAWVAAMPPGCPP